MVLAIAISLFAGSVILYAPSLGFGFIGYDDNTVLLEHPNLYNQGSLLASLREILVGYFPREEPLLVRDLSWLLDARLFGFTNPAGYHLGNVLLNAADGVLLFLFLLHATRKLALAGLTAAFFASLAIHVEPVCWVMGRKDLLGAFFTILALLIQSLALAEARPGRRRVWLLMVLVLCPLAVLAKFSAIVLVLLLAAHRVFAPFLAGTRGPREPLDLRWRQFLGLLPHLAVTVGLYLWYQRILAAFQIIGGRGPSPFSLQHLKTMALLVPLSLGRTLAHMGSAAEHSISYLRPNVALPLTAAEVGIIVVTGAGSVILLAAVLRFRKDLGFYAFAFFIFMLPYFNVEYIGFWVADRYAYLSSFCVMALLAALALEAWRSPRSYLRRLSLAAFLALACFAGYGVAAGRAHQMAFRDAHAFWAYERSRPQPSLLAFESLGKTFLEDAARAEPGSPARQQALEEVNRIAQEGIRYYQSLPWKPAPGYFSRELAHTAGLYSMLGHAAALAGGPTEQRLAFHRAAYQLMPSRLTALMLAQSLLDLAKREPRNEPLARDSLGYFEKYLRDASHDPLRRPGLRGLLREYSDSFPGLADDVKRIAEETLR
jgi:hypothetical protein